jgi:hypothetical protein
MARNTFFRSFNRPCWWQLGKVHSPPEGLECDGDLGKSTTLDQKVLACKTLVNWCCWLTEPGNFSRKQAGRGVVHRLAWVQYRVSVSTEATGQTNLVSSLVRKMTYLEARDEGKCRAEESHATSRGILINLHCRPHMQT